MPVRTLSRLPSFPRNPRNPHLLTLQEVHSASVLALCILVLLGSQDMVAAGWCRLRGLLVTGLKLAAATAPLFRMHALSTLQVRQAVFLVSLGCGASSADARHGAAMPRRRLHLLLHVQLQRVMHKQRGDIPVATLCRVMPVGAALRRVAPRCCASRWPTTARCWPSLAL